MKRHLGLTKRRSPWAVCWATAVCFYSSATWQYILQALVDYVDKHAPEAYVSLVAEPMAQKLYPLFGFKEVEPSIGMYRMIRGRRKLQEDGAEQDK
jgi:hypothetical protein